MKKYSTLLARLQSEVFIVEPNFASQVMENLQALSDGSIKATHNNIASDSVTYQEIGEVAVIAVDGAMYKKDISGMCQSVASYDTMIKYIGKAESNPNLTTIIFRVDTNGGSVAGADEVRDRIKNSKLKTILYAENMVASGGLWIFSAVDEIYSNDMTVLGSIGVLIAYEDKETKTKYLVSSNAPNKVCDIKDEKCKTKITARLNEYEAKFYERVSESFNKEKEVIKEDFDNGGTVFADILHKKGYIKELLSFNELLSRYNLASMPSTNEKIEQNSTQGETMSIKEKTTVEPSVEVDGEDTQANLASAKIKVVSNSKFAGNKEILSLVADPKATVADVKAKLFDLTESSELKVIEQIQKDNISAKADEIDTTTDDEDMEAKAYDEALMAYAKEHEGSIK